MSFSEISESYFSIEPSDRLSAVIEYRIADGAPIATGHQSGDWTVRVYGSGRVEFARRGDTGEGPDCPPGVWETEIRSDEVDQLWDRLGEITVDSIPQRLADPGEPITYLSLTAKGRYETMLIGPLDSNQTSPAVEVLTSLSKLRSAAEASACIWSAELSLTSITRDASGIVASAQFKNPGKEPIGLILLSENESSFFSFRYAQKRPEIPYPRWHKAKGSIAGPRPLQLARLDPGSILQVDVSVPCDFPDKGIYLGKLGYHQENILDSFLGQRVLSGTAFSKGLEFLA